MNHSNANAGDPVEQGNPDPARESGSGGRWFLAAALFSILALTVLLYGHTLSFPFVFDDWVYIIENPLTRDIPSFRFWLEPREFAALPLKLDLNPDVATNIMLRPLAYFTFHLNRMAGGDHPAGIRTRTCRTSSTNSA